MWYRVYTIQYTQCSFVCVHSRYLQYKYNSNCTHIVHTLIYFYIYNIHLLLPVPPSACCKQGRSSGTVASSYPPHRFRTNQHSNQSSNYHPVNQSIYRPINQSNNYNISINQSIGGQINKYLIISKATDFQQLILEQSAI